MAHSLVVVHPTAGDAATGKPHCNAAAHGGAHVTSNARPELDSHADTNRNGNSHSGPISESDGKPHPDANAHAECDDANADAGPDGIAHSHPDGVADSRTDRVADAHLDTDAGRWNVVPAQQPDASPERHMVSA
jgi:hypothetical protein